MSGPLARDDGRLSVASAGAALPVAEPSGHKRPAPRGATSISSVTTTSLPCARKGAATLLFLARLPGDAWIVDHELVFVEVDLGGEAPGAEADQPVA